MSKSIKCLEVINKYMEDYTPSFSGNKLTIVSL